MSIAGDEIYDEVSYVDPVNAIPLTAVPHIQAGPDDCEHYEWAVQAVLWGANAEIRKCLSCGHEWQKRLR